MRPFDRLKKVLLGAVVVLSFTTIPTNSLRAVEPSSECKKYIAVLNEKGEMIGMWRFSHEDAEYCYYDVIC
mgnify:CR=1 FL=1